MKKVVLFILFGLSLFFLAACGPKTPEEIIKTELKDSYVGYSELSGYDSLIFPGGGFKITFDKSNHKLKVGEEEASYEVVPEDKLSDSLKGILQSHEAELDGKDYFIINVGYDKDDIWGKLGDQLYGVVLEDSGKSIRIFEFETGYTPDGYFDFSGKSE